MDLQDSVLGECPPQNQNPLNDFQAGEFAQSSDVSPVDTRPAALGKVLSSLAASFLPDLYKLYLQSSTLVDRLTGCRLGLSSAQLAKHRRAFAHAKRREQRRFNALTFPLIQFAADDHFSPVAPLEAAITHYYPALRNITTRELSFFLPDDSFTSVRDLAEFFPSLKGAELFLDTFRLAHPEFNYTHLSVVQSALPQSVAVQS